MHYAAYLKKNARIIIALVVVAAGGVIITLADVSNHSNPPQTDLGKTLAKVAKLMILPTDESPTLATVTDKAKLKDKFLSAKSQTGDRVLIYAKNGTVIIYRPNINKIVGVGAVTGEPAFIQAQGATLTILDSTNNPSKVQKVMVAVAAAYPSIKVTDGGKSNRQDFPNTIVIDSTNEKSELRAALMKATSAKQGVQPSSEAVSNTDLTIIIGLD